MKILTTFALESGCTGWLDFGQFFHRPRTFVVLSDIISDTIWKRFFQEDLTLFLSRRGFSIAKKIEMTSSRSQALVRHFTYLNVGRGGFHRDVFQVIGTSGSACKCCQTRKYWPDALEARLLFNFDHPRHSYHVAWKIAHDNFATDRLGNLFLFIYLYIYIIHRPPSPYESSSLG